MDTYKSFWFRRAYRTGSHRRAVITETPLLGSLDRATAAFGYGLMVTRCNWRMFMPRLAALVSTVRYRSQS